MVEGTQSSSTGGKTAKSSRALCAKRAGTEPMRVNLSPPRSGRFGGNLRTVAGLIHQRKPRHCMTDWQGALALLPSCGILPSKTGKDPQ